ncbi:hypothetical protein CR983_02385 [Candidatus Saccharibacteria bacterium]|nr:MAG: hypothetical protein CR983_02385 [Candidatus Saccharibacteria bacterium]
MSIYARRQQRRTLETNTTPPLPALARYGHWVCNSGMPSQATLEAAAGHKLSYTTFNYDRREYAEQLKELDPDVSIMIYICLSSARDYEPTEAIAGAVSWNDAVANDWLALDVNGDRMPWGGYGGHYQAKVWDSAYQDAYIAHIDAVLQDPLVDGIWADNDMWTLQWYNENFFAGTSSREETDQKLRDGLDVLVARAGAHARSLGKFLMPNYSEGRNSLPRHAVHAEAGGGICEEQFANWGESGEPQLYDWGDGGWVDQQKELRSGEHNTAITYHREGDTRTALYGYTSFLLRAEPGEDGWTAMSSTFPIGEHVWLPFQDTPLGQPTGQATQADQVWTRSFEKAFVAVNPHQSAANVTDPLGQTHEMGALTGLIVPVQ